MIDPSGRVVHWDPGEPPDVLNDMTQRVMDAAERIPTPLYKIAWDWESVLIELEDGKITEAQAEERLVAIAGDFRQKALACAAVIRNFDSMARECHAEAARLTEREKRMEKRSAWLRSYVQRSMEAIDGLEKIEGGTTTLALRRNNPHVVVHDEGAVPRMFLRFPVTPPPEVDKTAILKHWRETGGDDGGDVPPGTSIERNVRLDIS